MNRATLARRYAPLAAVIAVQLLIIATVPSRAPSQDVAAGGPSFVDTGSGNVEGDAGTATVDTVIDPATGEAVAGDGSAGGSTGGIGSGATQTTVASGG